MSPGSFRHAHGGNELQPSGFLALGQGYLQHGGGAERGGDAWNNFNRNARRRKAAISSLARPKIIGSPPLRRTTRLPCDASATSCETIWSCRQEGL